jgi:hypothetical protein
MNHRHIYTETWTKEAIDSTLQRGNLQDWKELFQSVKKDREIANSILEMARFHREDGTFALVEGILQKMQLKNVR